MVGMGANALFGYKDVRISPNKRGSTLQTWGNEERVGVVKTLMRRPAAEGLGIDHEAWAKQKEEYFRN